MRASLNQRVKPHYRSRKKTKLIASTCLGVLIVRHQCASKASGVKVSFAGSRDCDGKDRKTLR